MYVPSMLKTALFETYRIPDIKLYPYTPTWTVKKIVEYTT